MIGFRCFCFLFWNKILPFQAYYELLLIDTFESYPPKKLCCGQEKGLHWKTESVITICVDSRHGIPLQKLQRPTCPKSKIWHKLRCGDIINKFLLPWSFYEMNLIIHGQYAKCKISFILLSFCFNEEWHIPGELVNTLAWGGWSRPSLFG